ncbi:hypothetical protein, partial [Mycobacterium tuberculosis]|uniref:hypothetical protein n=1 Tax=Mycobacterium tuberculosis TaxID=1773 RepID=UPI001243F1D6
TVPDTAVPVKLHVPIFLDIPVTGTLGTFTVHGFRFPEITGDIDQRVRPATQVDADIGKDNRDVRETECIECGGIERYADQ